MNKMWWKLLGAAILIAVIAVGMLVPLKPGIGEITNSRLTAGQDAIIIVEGYNTHFDEAKNKVWIKKDSNNIFPGIAVAESATRLAINIAVPKQVHGTGTIHPMTLITYNEVDGPTVTPNAVTVVDAEPIIYNWPKRDLSMITDKPGMQFPYRSTLNETIRNTFFHIPLWFSMFILLIAGLVYSIKYLMKRDMNDDIIASSVTTVAILFGILGVVTGSLWARFTWGAWWTPDVKLNLSATAMLIYCAYLVLRSSVADRDRKAQLSAAYSIFAFVALIPLVFIIPRLTDSLHPGNGGNPALGGEDMESTLRMVFYPAIIGFTLLGLWIASLSIRYQRLIERRYAN